MEELPYLVTFVHVVQAGSFAGGAGRLGLTPSVASKHVSKLERALGARLLQRSTRKLSLTDAGAAYYAHCARIIEELEQSREAVARLQAEPSGRLRISGLPSFIATVVAPLMPEFLRRYPKVDVEIVASEHAVDLAEEGFDLALRITGSPSPQLVARPLAPLRFVLCASPAYLAQHGEPADPQALATLATLGFPQQAGDNSGWHFWRGEQEERVAVRPRFAVYSFETLRRLTLAGSGLAPLPLYLVAEDLRRGHLRSVLSAYAVFSRPTLYAVYLPNRYGSPKLKAFVQYLASAIGEPPYWEKDLP